LLVVVLVVVHIMVLVVVLEGFVPAFLVLCLLPLTLKL
jgi:hypothetical protein|tara:strand:+ start:117 stop:230 length:114 start_codon:yes stop_codon:yes gene_type:complete